jgi:hypothetical protein
VNEVAKKDRARLLSDADLALMLEYVVINSTSLARFNSSNSPVYESVLLRVYIPEVLRRLRQQDVAQPLQTYTALRSQLEHLEDRLPNGRDAPGAFSQVQQTREIRAAKFLLRWVSRGGILRETSDGWEGVRWVEGRREELYGDSLSMFARAVDPDWDRNDAERS